MAIVDIEWVRNRAKETYDAHWESQGCDPFNFPEYSELDEFDLHIVKATLEYLDKLKNTINHA